MSNERRGESHVTVARRGKACRCFCSRCNKFSYHRRQRPVISRVCTMPISNSLIDNLYNEMNSGASAVRRSPRENTPRTVCRLYTPDSCHVSDYKLLQVIGQICTFDRGVPLAERARIKHRSIVRCERHFNTLNCLSVDYECDKQTDGRRDR